MEWIQVGNTCQVNKTPNWNTKTLIPISNTKNLIPKFHPQIPVRVCSSNWHPHPICDSKWNLDPKAGTTKVPQARPISASMKSFNMRCSSSSTNQTKSGGGLKSCSMTSASSTNHKRNPGPRIRSQNREDDYEGPKRFCHCGVPAPRWTSWTNWNPGRRFFGCRYYYQVSLGDVVDVFGYEC